MMDGCMQKPLADEAGSVKRLDGRTNRERSAQLSLNRRSHK